MAARQRRERDTDASEEADKRVDVNISPRPLKRNQYRGMIGGLLHASTGTRSDIGYAVRNVASQAESPTETDVIACKRTLRYLKGTSRGSVGWGW